MFTALALFATMQKPDEDRLASDWRNGAIVYQVIVDRFAPSEDLEAKKALYAAPRTLHPWSETPKGGVFVPEANVWSHEIAFWGGDLKSVKGKLNYVRDLGADVLYLNPIYKAFTNHKYDAQEYAEVSPEYGTRKDVKDLAESLHTQGMKLMLDGVFNHMGRSSWRFQEALKDPKSRYRDWFFFGPEYPDGYREWAGVGNMPELRLENPAVRDYIWAGTNSVVQKYLREGVDGWRLDVAFDIGPKFLGELTEAAHQTKEGSAVVGEIWNYPAEWFPSVDGVMNFHLRTLIMGLASGESSGEKTGRQIERMVMDSGLEHILQSWIVLDNHDTQRLATAIPDESKRHLAQALQFTLPGCPVVYYGSELGMTGGWDPEMRAPMRWDLVNAENTELAWVHKLIDIRKNHPALKYGRFQLLDSEKLLAFQRSTGKALDTVVVLVNPTDESVKERLSTRAGFMMNGAKFQDQLSKEQTVIESGTIRISVPPRGVRILVPINELWKGYTPYKRVI